MPVYIVRSGPVGPVKIGHAKDVVKRVKGLQTSHPVKLKLIRVLDGEQEAEAALHNRFADSRKSGEWFSYRDEMVAPDIGYPDLPIPPLRKFEQKYTLRSQFLELVRFCFDALGGADALKKRLRLAPWDNSLVDEVEVHFSAIAMLMNEAGYPDLTFQLLRDAHRSIGEEERRAKARAGEEQWVKFRSNRVEEELKFIAENGRNAVWWPLAPETLVALANPAAPADASRAA